MRERLALIAPGDFHLALQAVDRVLPLVRIADGIVEGLGKLGGNVTAPAAGTGGQTVRPTAGR